MKTITIAVLMSVALSGCASLDNSEPVSCDGLYAISNLSVKPQNVYVKFDKRRPVPHTDRYFYKYAKNNKNLRIVGAGWIDEKNIKELQCQPME